MWSILGWFLSLRKVHLKCIHIVMDIKPFLHPWNKSHLIVVYDPFNVLLNVVC